MTHKPGTVYGTVHRYRTDINLTLSNVSGQKDYRSSFFHCDRCKISVKTKITIKTFGKLQPYD